MERIAVDLDLLKKAVPGWNDANETNIKIKALSVFDSESAALYRVKYANSPLNITYRRFDNEECFKKYKLPEDDALGPKLIYSQYPIMIHEYITEAKAPGLDGILKPKVYNSLFRELTKYHKIRPGDEFTGKTFLSIYLNMKTEEQSPTALANFCQACDSAQNRDDLTEKDKSSFKKIQKILDETEFISKLVKPLRLFWCHNDLHESNLLWDPITNKITLLDFEDSAYNFRGYDLANVLLETEWDLIDEYPNYRKLGAKYDQKDEERFLLLYTLHWIDPIWEKNPALSGIELESLSKDDIKVLIPNEEERELFWENFEEVKKEYFIGKICTSYVWTIWNALQFSVPEEDWLHLELACMKFDLYYECKKAYLDVFDVII